MNNDLFLQELLKNAILQEKYAILPKELAEIKTMQDESSHDVIELLKELIEIMSNLPPGSNKQGILYRKIEAKLNK